MMPRMVIEVLIYWKGKFGSPTRGKFRVRFLYALSKLHGENGVITLLTMLSS